MEEVERKLEEIKGRNMEVFDLLARQDELLSADVEKVGYLFDQPFQGEIREED